MKVKAKVKRVITVPFAKLRCFWTFLSKKPPKPPLFVSSFLPASIELSSETSPQNQKALLPMQPARATAGRHQD